MAKAGKYDMGVPMHRHLTRRQVARMAPDFKAESITGAIRYYDCQVDDARMVVAVARTAAKHGAHVATRVKVTGFLREGERVVVSTRTHPKALLLPVLALVLLLAVGTFVETRVDGDQRLLAWIVWGAVALGVLWLFVWPLLTWLVGHYTITDRRIITRTGVLTRRGHDIPLSRISDVQVERHLSDRLLGCGTLVIGDASPDGAVALPDIPRVREAQARLNDLLHALHSRGGRHDEGA